LKTTRDVERLAELKLAKLCKAQKMELQTTHGDDGFETADVGARIGSKVLSARLVSFNEEF
jgi:hypothetical protein